MGSFYKQGKPQKVIAVLKLINVKLSGREKCGYKGAQATGVTTALRDLSKEVDSRTCKSLL